MNKHYYHMIIELILYYWIGREPCSAIDKYIYEFMKEKNLTPESLVSERDRLRKIKILFYKEKND